MTAAAIATPADPQPAACTCTRMVVDTLAETLDCPALWFETPRGTWAHILPTWGRRMEKGRVTR